MPMCISCKMFKYVFILLASATIGYGAPSSSPDLRIIHGTDAAEGQFPYQVSLRLGPSRKHLCGGSIITPRTILLAARCFLNFDANSADPIPFKVYAGSVELDGSGKFFEVEKIIPHESYMMSENDIGLVILKEAINFSENKLMQIIELDKDYIDGGIKANATGWGYTEINNHTTPNRLKFAELKTVSHEECARYAPPGLIRPFHLCAFAELQGEGTNRGDSGGPLTVRGKQIGVTSFIINTGDKRRPNVFTRVSSYIDWINKHKV